MFLTRLWLLILLLLSDKASSKVSESGFELLFTSNSLEVTNQPLTCQKSLPNWLNGTWIRNGPGRFEMGNQNFTHPFDGFAKLYSWKFRPGKPILFSTKFVQTGFYNQSLSDKSVAPYLLFDSVEPPFSYMEQWEQFWNGIDNPNINVYQFGESKSLANSQFVAVSDFWEVYQFDFKSLATKSKIKAAVPNTKSVLSSLPLPSSSHPLPEHGTDNYINFVTMMNPLPFGRSTINVVRIKSATDRDLIARIRVRKIPYMHSFGLSKNYCILFASPLYINVGKMLKTGRPLKSLDWDEDTASSLYVVHLKTGKVIKMKTETVLAMHHVNAFEVNSTVIQMDVVTYPNINLFNELAMSNLKNQTRGNSSNTPAALKRYTLNLETKQVDINEFAANDDREIFPGVKMANKLDMPVINEKKRQENYCYVYGFVIQADEKHLSTVALAKKNLCGGKDQIWYQENHYPLEPWFVAPPGNWPEDAGLLMSVVMDGDKKQSYILILNARNMQPLNKCYLNTPIPFTLHGRFFPNLV